MPSLPRSLPNLEGPDFLFWPLNLLNPKLEHWKSSNDTMVLAILKYLLQKEEF